MYIRPVSYSLTKNEKNTTNLCAHDNYLRMMTSNNPLPIYVPQETPTHIMMPLINNQQHYNQQQQYNQYQPSYNNQQQYNQNQQPLYNQNQQYQQPQQYNQNQQYQQPQQYNQQQPYNQHYQQQPYNQYQQQPYKHYQQPYNADTRASNVPIQQFNMKQLTEINEPLKYNDDLARQITNTRKEYIMKQRNNDSSQYKQNQNGYVDSSIDMANTRDYNKELQINYISNAQTMHIPLNNI